MTKIAVNIQCIKSVLHCGFNFSLPKTPVRLPCPFCSNKHLKRLNCFNMLFQVALFISLVIYYLYSHFLPKSSKTAKLPPGPLCLPIFGYLPFLGPIPSVTITNLSKKYGSIFTVHLGRTRCVFVNDVESAKEAGKLDVLQGRHQLALFEPRGYAGLGLLEGKDWQEMRRFTLKCLRDMGFGKRSMEGMIQEQVENVKDYLKKNSDKPLYLKPVLELAVINSIWAIMTSEKYDIEDPAKRHLMSIMTEGIAEQNIVGISAFVPWLAKLAPDYTGYSKGLEWLGAPESLARDVIKKHIDTYSPEHERDFIDVTLTKIYNTSDPKSVFFGEFGLRNLHYTLLDMFFAGSDTMSSTLGWTFLYMASFPHVQSKVFQEIETVVGKNRIPCLEDRIRMPYTEATMLEVLRKSSMVPLGLMHTALTDTEFQGFFIPKRTVLLFNLYHIHHDPVYWGDPHNFRPERFIEEDGCFKKDDHVIAFFTGKRSCPGESLAINEYFLFFTGLLQKFSFELNPEAEEPNLGPRSGFILPPPKHNLVVKERS